MPSWIPGNDPFPSTPVSKISDFQYQNELHFVRHATVHVDKVPKSLWQVSEDFRVTMKVHTKKTRSKELEINDWDITVPQGMFTDLASVPGALWSIVGPIGEHLEASIVHDYLYMAWTDFRKKPLKRDWNFADDVFMTGMEVSGVSFFQRNLIFTAVRLAGWEVFETKNYTLEERMNEWLPLLDSTHGRDETQMAT